MAEPAGGPSEERRVKLYRNDEEGQWIDQGTGHIAIVKGPMGRFSLVMRSETETDESGFKVILNTPLAQGDIYQPHGETLVMWDDPFMSETLALSFQSPSGCAAVLDTMRALQQGQADTDEEPASEEPVVLPEPEITSLSSLHAALCKVAASSPAARRRFAPQLTADGFLQKLFLIFEQCEDLDDMEALHTLFRIFVALILFNDLHVLGVLFEPANLLKLLGVLEYDPLFHRRLGHRQYLQSGVQFREAVQLKPALKAKVHEAYKLQYLKDSVVARYLDDAAAATMNGLVAARQAEIISDICKDDDMMDAMGKLLVEGGEGEKVQVLRLLQEMQTFAKNLAPQGKAEFLAALCGNGILRTVADLMLAAERPVQRLAVDVVSQALQHEPGILRGFVAEEEERGVHCSLLSNLAQRLVGAETPDAERVEMLELLRQLLETGQRPAVQIAERAVVTSPEEMQRVLEIFYDTCVPLLLQPLLSDPPEADAGCSRALPHVLDLLSFCVAQHGDFARRVVLQRALVPRVTALLGAPGCPPTLAAAIARFLKALLVIKEEAYCRQLIRAGSFKVLIDLLLRNRERGNLLFSTVLATFEVIRREGIRPLMGHLVETYAEALQPVQSLDTINAIFRLWNLTNDRTQAAIRETLRQLQNNTEERMNEDPPSPPEPPAAPEADCAPGDAAAGAQPTSPVALVAYGEDDGEAETRPVKKLRTEADPAPLVPDAS